MTKQDHANRSTFVSRGQAPGGSESSVSDDIRVLKQTFGPRTERYIITDLIRENIPVGHINWLDIGVGDCVSTSKMLGELYSRNYTADVVGIDPELDSAAIASDATDKYDLRKIGIESLDEDISKFDVINIRQSSYYFDDPILQLTKLISGCRNGQIIIITHWSSACTLYRAHRYFRNYLKMREFAPTIEDIMSLLVLRFPECDPALAHLYDSVDVGLWADSADVATAAFNITSRVSAPISDSEKLSLVRKFSSSLKSRESIRANVVLFIKPKVFGGG